MATRKTAFNRDVSIAQIEASRATEVRDEELRKSVEKQRALTELERLRASDVVKATILREAKQQAADAKNYEENARANADYYSQQKLADAKAYQVGVAAEAKLQAAAKDAEAELVRAQKTADAENYKVTVAAEAKLIEAQKAAEGELVRQEKAARGLSAMAGAYKEMSDALGGPQGLIQYLMIEKGVYTDLAKANADAVRGLNPKMTIWNTGSQAGNEGGEGGGMGGVDSIRNMYQVCSHSSNSLQHRYFIC